MKKIMFNDKYGLTQAVLEGRKTMTRRIVPINLYNQTDWKVVEEGNWSFDCPLRKRQERKEYFMAMQM